MSDNGWDEHRIAVLNELKRQSELQNKVIDKQEEINLSVARKLVEIEQAVKLSKWIGGLVGSALIGWILKVLLIG